MQTHQEVGQGAIHKQLAIFAQHACSTSPSHSVQCAMQHTAEMSEDQTMTKEGGKAASTLGKVYTACHRF